MSTTADAPSPDRTTSTRMLFVNLPVADPAATKTFWSTLGFSINEAFCDANATAVQLNEQAAVMFLETSFFHSFHGTTTPPSGTGGLYCVSAASREDVDDLCRRALAAGGSPASEPVDHGAMYGWSFRDLDGHLWEVMWMDPAAMG
ncbi:VOC family protein [Nocardioides alkalitolerans]|uniref:VOC family protein n=1 Tax=Nocardioides alkalitolerans TaxID=281714 RepID=UPI00041B37B1|nr:VOC family protein [Nocardioides alkalitolerans]